MMKWPLKAQEIRGQVINDPKILKNKKDHKMKVQKIKTHHTAAHKQGFLIKIQLIQPVLMIAKRRKNLNQKLNRQKKMIQGQLEVEKGERLR